MELGKSGAIAVAQIGGEFIQSDINRWLEQNREVEVIDIKLSSSANNDGWVTDALIIYRK